MVDKPIIVIGAGIVGVSTAIWLQRAGHEVLLLDKGKPGMGASFGNAGLLAQWAMTPVNTPGLWKDAPRYLIDPNGPLFMKWLQIPKLLPWITKFMSHATDHGARRIVDNLIPLVSDSVDQHKSLVEGTPLASWIRDSKFSYAYPDLAAFQADAFSWEMKAKAGFIPTVLTGAEVREAEPILGPSTQCLAVLEGHGHITNPGLYVAELAEFFVKSGGRFISAEVKDFTLSGGQVRSVATDQGLFDCAKVVLTAGIWSKDLMTKLGLKIPMETERGYHVLYKDPSQLPRDPMMITAGKFGVNPMDMGLRCAGMVELGDHHTGPSKAPLALLRKKVAAAFPDMTYSGTEEWMGFRPTPPDSTPVIGELNGSGIFAGFGHQHVGLTAGPKTGRLIAQLLSGAPPNLDMTPYAPDRFLQ